ncbi:MAG: methylated-DNA--[protein]-cysteine S-methyltransferase [Thermoleophilia bacterium]|nr:methylated-DNA--[protein]-cysteine S-methyltransferase [Thermoleophilia bacterium]
MRHATVDSPLGDMVLVADGDALVGAFFAGQRYMPPAGRMGDAVGTADEPLLARAAAELAEYFAARRTAFTVPLRPVGSAFARGVWDALRAIPHGATTTYGAIARGLGRPGAAQGVGQAVGHNPVSVFIPCHRVVGADGSLTGYAGGLARKERLLELEGGAGRSLALFGPA